MSGLVQIPLTKGQFAIIDAEDAPLVCQFKWYAYRSKQSWYAARNIVLPDGRRKKTHLHTALTGFSQTDHINGDGLDNRRANLRSASCQQNLRNQRKRSGTASRFKGVYTTPKGRWRAGFCLEGKSTHLGHFATETAAAQAYDDAARLHFGEFAALNFPQPGERCALATHVVDGDR